MKESTKKLLPTELVTIAEQLLKAGATIVVPKEQTNYSSIAFSFGGCYVFGLYEENSADIELKMFRIVAHYLPSRDNGSCCLLYSTNEVSDIFPKAMELRGLFDKKGKMAIKEINEHIKVRRLVLYRGIADYLNSLWNKDNYELCSE